MHRIKLIYFCCLYLYKIHRFLKRLKIKQVNLLNLLPTHFKTNNLIVLNLVSVHPFSSSIIMVTLFRIGDVTSQIKHTLTCLFKTIWKLGICLCLRRRIKYGTHACNLVGRSVAVSYEILCHEI